MSSDQERLLKLNKTETTTIRESKSNKCQSSREKKKLLKQLQLYTNPQESVILLRSLDSESSRHLSNTLTVQMKSPTDQRKTLHCRQLKVYYTRTTAPFKRKHSCKTLLSKKERKNKILIYSPSCHFNHKLLL